MKRALATSLAAAAFVALPHPAAAQDQGGDKVNTVILYGEDKCPQSAEGVINVCAHLPESERYRIPQVLRESSSPQNESWTNKVLSYEAVGNFGPLSCTPFGAGGELGCTAKMIEQAYAERAGSSDVRFGQLIAQARAERLSTVDQEAAATQARVEQAEQEYLARQGASQANDASTQDRSEPQPTRVVDPNKLARPPGQ
jgi:hypothetical protein